MGERLEPRAPPVSRANLLVGKLGLLHQTPDPSAKEFTQNGPIRGVFVAPPQQTRGLRHTVRHLRVPPWIAPAQAAGEALWCTVQPLVPAQAPHCVV